MKKEKGPIWYAQYKSFERYFVHDHKSKDLKSYLKLKFQFRLVMVASTVSALFGLSLLFFYGLFLPGPFITAGVTLIGFKLKSEKIVTGVLFGVLVMMPFYYYKSPKSLVTFISILGNSNNVFFVTQSSIMMFIYFLIHAVAMYLKGLDSILNVVKNQSPEELADNVKMATYYTLVITGIGIIMAKVHISYMSGLFRKINALKDSLTQANVNLNTQNTKLQDSLEMKEVFIYTFSHELKNALNGLLGNLNLAYDAAKNSPAMNFLSSARVCGEVLKNFVHNILDSGKLEIGHLEASCEKRDVMSLMENVWAICGRIIVNKRLDGYLEIESDVPRYLELDEQRMIQIMLNLTSNAVKFTEKGRVYLRVSWQSTSATSANLGDSNKEQQQQQQLEESKANIINYDIQKKEILDTSELNAEDISDAVDDSPSRKSNQHLFTMYPKKFIKKHTVYHLNCSKWQWQEEEVLSDKSFQSSHGTLKIQVIDTGCGIPPEKQALLFQKFSQVHQSVSQRKVGTGLGLWICKELSNRLCGDIAVRSSVGVGSIFEFTTNTTIPQSSEFSSSPLISNSHQRNSSMYASLHSLPFDNKKKTLIADDDSFNIELLKNYLDKLGVSYVCAYDGEEAVLLFKKHYEDICFIITDNFMPKKTGTEAAEEIAMFLRDKNLPSIPIVCVSGDIKVSVGSCGITSVMQKPINFDGLMKKLISAYSRIPQ